MRSGQSKGPEGRALKHSSASLQLLLRTKAINGELRLAAERFRTRRGTLELIRGTPSTRSSVLLVVHAIDLRNT